MFSSQGFHNLYHKEEFGHKKKFFDNAGHKKFFKNHDHLDKHFKKHHGGHHKGGHFKVKTESTSVVVFRLLNDDLIIQLLFYICHIH